MNPTSSHERITNNRAIYSIHARLSDEMTKLSLPGAWQQCAFSFLQSIYDLSSSDESLYSYHGILCRFFASGLDPDSVTKTDIESFISRASQGRGRVGRPVAPATRNHRLCVLSSFYAYASTYSIDGQPLYTKASPVLGIAYSQPDIVYKALNEQELTAFFDAIPDTPVGWRDRALYLMYFWTARRKSEIARLRWKDIEPATFKVDETHTRAGYVYRYTGKGKSRQTKAKELPMPAYTALIDYLKRSGRYESMQPDSPLFLPTKLSGKRDRVGNTGIAADYIGLQFKRYAAFAGLDPKFTLHSLRHAASHERDQAGQDVYGISSLLDHSNIGTTFTYLRRMSGTSDSGVPLLERKFAGLGASG